MKKTNDKSAKRKLIPAVSMLAVSAVMLSTATYAWFTMSKEVSVTGISMTAQVPETLQISLGTGDSGTFTEPTSDDDDESWTNTVDASTVYGGFGKLIPASSVDGKNIFYTLNAIKTGKEIKNGAVFQQADANDEIADLQVAGGSALGDGTDGYYVDIPVWFRTSASGEATDTVDLSVAADVKNVTTGELLYTAARVSILDASGATNSANQGVINPEGSAYIDNKAATGNVAVKAAGTYNTTSKDNIYGAVTAIAECNGTNKVATTSVVVKVPKNTTTSVYGTPVEKTIRIWLEGEDVNCWNANAGQNFTVALTFYDQSNLAT